MIKIGKSIKCKSISHQGLELSAYTADWDNSRLSNSHGLWKKKRFKTRSQNGFLWVVHRTHLEIRCALHLFALPTRVRQIPATSFWGQSSWLIYFKCNTRASVRTFFFFSCLFGIATAHCTKVKQHSRYICNDTFQSENGYLIIICFFFDYW